MTYTEKYFDHVTKLLRRVLETQQDNIRALAQKAFEVSRAGGKLFIFGCSHASILAQEAFYRTGGLVIINPIMAKGLTLETVPVTATTALERKPEYALEILNSVPIGAGDLLIIHSVSGRNGVPVEMALEAKRRGVFTAAITNITTSSASSSRHPSGKRLFEVCDLVIDNCGCVGDAAIPMEGFRGKTAATSTVTGAAIVNAFCAEVAGLYVEHGLEPPVFMSANVDGGDAYNETMLERYKDRITYQG